MSAVNPMTGSSGVHRNRVGKGTSQQSELVGDKHSSHGSSRVRNAKGEHKSSREREKRHDQALFQQLERKPPPCAELEQLQEYFTLLENDLRQWSKQMNHVDAPDKTMEKWDRIIAHTEEYMTTATRLFIHDTAYYVTTEIDIRVWKYGIYQFITILRNVSPDSPKKDASILALNELCQKGIQHLKFFLINAGKYLHVNLEPIVNSNGFLKSSSRKDELSDKENLCYRLFIAVGDSYRYRYLPERSRNFRDAQMAINMYKAARFCDTTKSRAYYQLALMSKVQNDVIGTICNYTRALSTSPAIEGLNSQLRFLYDDIYKQFQSVKLKYWFTLMKAAEKRYSFVRPTKIEKWMVPTLTLEGWLPPAMQLPPSKEQHFNSLSDVEVLEQFSLCYAHFLGMLFTNIGTETLEDVGKEVVIYFEGLLVKGNFSLEFMLELFGLLLFMTDYLEPPAETGDMASHGASLQIKYMREKAVEVTLNMLIILCEKLLRAIKLFDWDSPILVLSSTILHVWCRWVKRRPYLCLALRKERKLVESNPRKYNEDLANENFHMGKFAVTFSRLLTEVTPLLRKHYNMVFPEITVGITATCKIPMCSLPELVVLDGFGDLIKSQDFDVSRLYHNGRFNEARLLVHFRLARFVRFGCTLFPDLKQSRLYSIKNNWSTVQHPIDIYMEHEFPVTSWIHAEQGKPVRSDSAEKLTYKVKNARPDCNNGRIIIKSTPKGSMDLRDIRRQKEFKTPPVTKTYEIWQDMQVKGVRVELFITPLHIVLDTNILIHKLHWAKQLIPFAINPIVIPSAVLSELRCLARGGKTGYSPRFSQKGMTHEEKQKKTIDMMEIGEHCTEALDFLNENRSHFRVVTISGKEIKMYNYHKQKVYDEWVNPTLCNDEKIMETCAYLELKDKDARSRDTPVRIRRKLVLLTGDRALRVRSFAQDIPARDIESYILWFRNSIQLRLRCNKILAEPRAQGTSWENVLPIAPRDYRRRKQRRNKKKKRKTLAITILRK